MTLPENNSAVLLLGRQRETHTRKPGVHPQPDLQQIPLSPNQNETRGNPQIVTGIPEGQEPLQCQYPSILLQSACSEHGGEDANCALSSPPLFSEQTVFWKGGKGVSFELLWVFLFPACPPPALRAVGAGLQLACGPPAARWR